MSHNKYDQTLALAGIYQAASLVKQIANEGKANNAQIESSLETLFRFDANTVEEIYGNVDSVRHGIEVLQKQLSEKSDRDVEVTKYVISMIMLEKKLSRSPDMLKLMDKRLKAIESQFNFFALDHENTFAKIAHLYKDTISTLGPKIMISGEQPYLGNEYIASKVRALLLAGIRSAVLWHQCGGSRIQFIFGRKAYIDECEKILS